MQNINKIFTCNNTANISRAWPKKNLNSCDKRYILPSAFKWIAFAARHVQQMKHVDIQQDCEIHEYHHRHFEEPADVSTAIVNSKKACLSEGICLFPPMKMAIVLTTTDYVNLRILRHVYYPNSRTANNWAINKCIRRSSVIQNTAYYKRDSFRPIFRAIVRPVQQNPTQQLCKLSINLAERCMKFHNNVQWLVKKMWKKNK